MALQHTLPNRPKREREKYTHYIQRRRQTEEVTLKSVISGVFDDVFGEIWNKVTDPQMRMLKLKAYVGFGAMGLVCGHTYAVYRGFTKLNLYGRHLLVGAGTGTLCSFPFIAFLNIKHKQYPSAYMVLRGGLLGAVCGLAHRGSVRFMGPYALAGMMIHGCILFVWHHFAEPIYYYHLLAWPDYYPPKWWPSQPMTGFEIYLNEMNLERLNVTYPEDIEYFEQMDPDKEQKLQQIKAAQLENDFVFNSEVQEKQQLEDDELVLKPNRNIFGI